MKAGDQIRVHPSGWSFRGPVVNVFEDHVRKSVPLYLEGQRLILSLSDYFITDDSICIDLGCSTGILSYDIAERHKNKNFKIFAFDIEEDMISYAKEKYKSDKICFEASDICEVVLEESNFIYSYYTVQFIDYHKRKVLFQKIYDSLRKGGAFILFEKVYAKNSRYQDMLTGAYMDFKNYNGYNFEEILSKSLSIRGVLKPNSTNENIKMLNDVGFDHIDVISRYCKFEGYLIIK